MKAWLCALLIAVGATTAAASDKPTSASGILYFIFDLGADGPDGAMDGVLFARFVPDDKSRAKFPAVTNGSHPGPVRYVSFEPADEVLAAVVGASTAAQLSHGRERIVQVPVTITFQAFHAEVECDSRVYYAKFLSATPVGTPTVPAGTVAADNGC